MKNARQTAILSIIEQYDVETQEELAGRLKEMGIVVTQATVSRDIKELRIVKELTNLGTYRYTAANKESGGTFSTRLNTIFRECITSYDFAQNIVVIKTMPGLASAACSAIDSMGMPVVLGSLAGDDTAILIMRDTNAAGAFCAEIKQLLS